MKSYFYLLFASALLFITGCGGGSSDNGSGGPVSISPSTATVVTSATQQFTATVQNSTNSSVIWQVNGIAGGNVSVGTISGTGLYTAPTSVPTAAVTISAISVADSTKTGDATVTVVVPISISPTTATVQATLTQTFSASVNFSKTTTVTWTVNGVSGGNSTVGTINSSGLYTAPSTVPSPSTVTVTAVANADNTKTAFATVTVTPPDIVISPTSATVVAGAQQTFTATVLSNSAKPSWSVSCPSTVSGGCGSITSDGVFTAPITPPPHQQVTVTASMTDGSAATESIPVTIQFGNASLSGTYIFTLTDEIAHQAASIAGTLVLNGAGQVTGGMYDNTDFPGAPITVTGGTYQVGTDGRGTAAVQTASGTLNLEFVLSSNQHGFLLSTDSTSNQAAGVLELQQANASTALNGGYSFLLSGSTTGSSSSSLQEAGSILTSSAGTISGGLVDLNQFGVLQTVSVSAGSHTSPSAGRGTVTFTTSAGAQTFAYYPVDNIHAKLVPIDGTVRGLGELFSEPQGPFSASTLKGKYVFSAKGTKSGAPYGVAGVFTADGAGNISNLQFDGINQTVFDSNSGAYSVTDAATGRTTATWTGKGGSKLQYILYPRADGGVVLLQSDSTYVGSGEAIPQANSSVANFLTLKGSFAMRLGGSDFATPTTPQRAVAQLGVPGDTTMVGTADGNPVGKGVEVSLNLLSQNLTSQRYSFGSSVSGLASGTIVVYRITDDRAFAIVSDDKTILTGAFKRQY